MKLFFLPWTLESPNWARAHSNDAGNQSGFQSGLETVPLAAVSARYCQSVGHFTAKSV